MGIIKANEILKESYRFLKLSTAFSYIMGNLPSEKQWTMLLHGIAGSGKSTFALLFAKELTRFSNVLYGNFEERVWATLQAKLKLTNLKDNRRIHFIEPNTEEIFWDELGSGIYKFAVVDSLSHIASQEKQVAMFWERVREHPKINFIFICHALKSKDGKTETNYRGASTLGHIVDINQRVVEGGGDILVSGKKAEAYKKPIKPAGKGAWVMGEECKIHTPREVISDRYAVTSLSNIEASHLIPTFSKNPKNPCNERRYEVEKMEQGKVINNANKFKPEFLINTDNTPENGAMIVDEKGVVLGGNGVV